MTIDAQPKIDDPSERRAFVFAFGRFNPPHKGHIDLVNTVVALGKRYKAKSSIALSIRVGQKDPLRFDEKLRFVTRSFPEVKFFKAVGYGANPYDSIKMISDSGFKHLIVVAGSDRVDFFERNIRKLYEAGHYRFTKIQIFQRDRSQPVSGALIRQLVKSDRLDVAASLLSHHLSEAEKFELLTKVREGLAVEHASKSPEPGVLE